MKNIDIRTLRHEAEYYGITPLVRRLMLCEDLTQSSCGDVLFYGYLPPPSRFLIIFHQFECHRSLNNFSFTDIPLQEPTTVTSKLGDVSIHGRAIIQTSSSRVDIPSTSQLASSNLPNPNGID